MRVLWPAVQAGYVSHASACFVAEGLRFGFKAGVAVSRMHGHRWFKNYPGALEHRAAVTDTFVTRVANGKTLDLGEWSNELASCLRSSFSSTAIFPMNAVPKPLEPGKYRQTSDHTRTGLNACVDVESLRHSLQADKEISWALKQDWFMRVSDVESAFPILPWHPDVWPYLFCRFFPTSGPAEHLFLHLFGDFGAAGFPGTFKIFYVDCVVQMARFLQILRLPMPVHVDDNALIGPDRLVVDAMMEAYHSFCQEVLGVFFKSLKDKLASQRQLMIGFVWDSRTLTRELDERRLLQYISQLSWAVTQKRLTLREMQSLAGKMQRIVLTFPPGASCLLANLYKLSVGLTLPWHSRRLSHAAKMDMRLVLFLLTINLGCGYYSYINFVRKPEIRSDAASERRKAGAGYVSRCGAYDWWVYGTCASRKPIDYLEGDATTVAAERMGPKWRGGMVPMGVDNSAFEQAAKKGRSRAERLNDLIKELFYWQLHFNVVFDFFWLSTVDNKEADHLSRDRFAEFMATVRDTGFWSSETVPDPGPYNGSVRTLPSSRGVVHSELRVSARGVLYSVV